MADNTEKKIKMLQDDSQGLDLDKGKLKKTNGEDREPSDEHDTDYAEIALEEVEDRPEVESYVQLAKILSSEDVTDIKEVVAILNQASFLEDDEIMYDNRPAKVFYKQLPIVANDEIKVKIVLLTQADSLALIIPEGVSDVYEILVDDPSKIIEVNKDLSLYAEVYNFNSNDPKLHDIIKTAYLTAGEYLRAFDIPQEMEDQASQEEGEDGEGGDDLDSDFSDFDDDFDTGGDNFENMFGDGGSADFDEMGDDFDNFEEVNENAHMYESFRKQSSALEALLVELDTKVESKLHKYIKYKFLKDGKGRNNLLALEVNNKELFDKYQKVPKLAKRIMTSIGEHIRRDDFTQLVDTFIKENKRYFIIAENLGNNFWITENDHMEVLGDYNGELYDPIQDEIITLRRSSVRMESRKLKPYVDSNKILFKGRKVK